MTINDINEMKKMKNVQVSGHFGKYTKNAYVLKKNNKVFLVTNNPYTAAYQARKKVLLGYKPTGSGIEIAYKKSNGLMKKSYNKKFAGLVKSSETLKVICPCHEKDQIVKIIKVTINN